MVLYRAPARPTPRRAGVFSLRSRKAGPLSGVVAPGTACRRSISVKCRPGSRVFRSPRAPLGGQSGCALHLGGGGLSRQFGHHALHQGAQFLFVQIVPQLYVRHPPLPTPAKWTPSPAKWPVSSIVLGQSPSSPATPGRAAMAVRPNISRRAAVSWKPVVW